MTGVDGGPTVRGIARGAGPSALARTTDGALDRNIAAAVQRSRHSPLFPAKSDCSLI